MKHSELPWVFKENPENREQEYILDYGLSYQVYDNNGDVLFDDRTYYETAPSKENAALIVRAVNCFYPMLEVLKMTKDDLDDLIENGQDQMKDSAGYKAICNAITAAEKE